MKNSFGSNFIETQQVESLQFFDVMFSTIRTSLNKSISTTNRTPKKTSDGPLHVTSAKFETPDFGPITVKEDGGIIVNKKHYSTKTIEKYWQTFYYDIQKNI